MYKGSLVELNTAQIVLNNPSHPYTKALLESRATYNKKGLRLSEIDDLLENSNGKFKFKLPKISKIPSIEESEEVILEIDRLEKSHFKSSLFKKYETKVLHSVSFKLNKGDSLGLIGESGSGKSTIAKIILDIWTQTQGTIHYDGKAIKSIRDLSTEIQLVFQDPFSSLNPKNKIGNAILEVFRTSDKSKNKQDVCYLLEEVGLKSSDFGKYPHEFSGGQRQRICIAKALAKNPRIIVLDEAVSALDVSVQAKILNLLNTLKNQKGLTYLLISHDMNVVSYFCNKIVILKDGKVIEAGNTDQLISKPKSNYTKSLLEHSIN